MTGTVPTPRVQSRLRFAVIAPMLIMAALAAVFFAQVRYLLTLEEWVDHADRVIAGANELLQVFVDGETGIRGYLVTGEQHFLEPYHRSIAASPATIAHLQKLISDNLDQQERLHGVLLVQGKWEQLAEKMLGMHPTTQRAEVVSPHHLGKELMDSTRRGMAQLIAAEQKLRDERVDETHRALSMMMLTGLPLLLAAAGVVTWISNRSVAAVSRSYQDNIVSIQELNASLQSGIDERTRLLAQAQQASDEAQRSSQLKDEFLATLSHELRTPLNAILGWTQLLRAGREPLTEEIQQGLEVIERNTHLQVKLIEDLLDVSRIITGKLRLDVQQVELQGIVEACVESLQPAADAKAIRLGKVLDPAASPIRGDPNRLQQVVWNLLSNAIKFTPKGGRIQVALQRVNSHVEVVVSDSGRGIDGEFLPHVFERFRQADSSTRRGYGGLGLGLAIVRHLTELHGGTIEAASEGEGKGSTFTLKLPLPAATGEADSSARCHPTSQQNPAPPGELPTLKGLRIMVVDDDPDALSLLKKILARCGAEVQVAETAHEALRTIGTFRPNVLISDIGMPDRDGYDLLSELRKTPADLGGDTPAIALTAFARPEDRRRALQAGYQMHLAKPVEPAELVTVIASLTGVAPGRRTVSSS